MAPAETPDNLRYGVVGARRVDSAGFETRALSAAAAQPNWGSMAYRRVPFFARRICISHPPDLGVGKGRPAPKILAALKESPEVWRLPCRVGYIDATLRVPREPSVFLFVSGSFVHPILANSARAKGCPAKTIGQFWTNPPKYGGTKGRRLYLGPPSSSEACRGDLR